jgi:hypothetical protein
MLPICWVNALFPMNESRGSEQYYAMKLVNCMSVAPLGLLRGQAVQNCRLRVIEIGQP